MPRAAFIHVANVYEQVSFLTPGDLLFTVACRFVLRTRYLSGDPTAWRYDAYVNYVGPATSAGSEVIVPPDLSYDYSVCDLWEFDFDPGVLYFNFWDYVILPKDGVPYRRAYLLLA